LSSGEGRRMLDQVFGARSRSAAETSAGLPPAAPNAAPPRAPVVPAAAVDPGDRRAVPANAATDDAAMAGPGCIAVVPAAEPRPLAYFQEADGVRLRAPGDKTGAWTFMFATPDGAMVRANETASARTAPTRNVPAPVLPEIVYTGMMQFGKNRMATFA